MTWTSRFMATLVALALDFCCLVAVSFMGLAFLLIRGEHLPLMAFLADFSDVYWLRLPNETP
jgi:hypothetical protein